MAGTSLRGVPVTLGSPGWPGGAGTWCSHTGPGLSPPLQFGVSPRVWLSPVQPPCPLHRWGSGVMGCMSPGGWWHLQDLGAAPCTPCAPHLHPCLSAPRSQVTEAVVAPGPLWHWEAAPQPWGPCSGSPLGGSEWPQPLPHSQLPCSPPAMASPHGLGLCPHPTAAWGGVQGGGPPALIEDAGGVLALMQGCLCHANTPGGVQGVSVLVGVQGEQFGGVLVQGCPPCRSSLGDE